MAMVSSRVTAEIIDVERFPEVGRKYNVSGVPKAVINDRLEFIGAAPEDVVLEKIMSLNTP